jgi:hypothetical protein
MNYKILLVALFSLTLIVSLIGSICIVKADTTSEPKVSYDTWGADSIWSPWVRGGMGQENLTMVILSPLSNEVLSNNTAILKINIGTQTWPINSVYYEADWQEGMHRIYSLNNQTSTKMLYRLSITANFAEIPDGRHRITVYANIHDGSQGSFSIDFTIDALPSISILSPENKTYQTADLPLNFTVNEPVKWVGYRLDGKKNITITSNSTITNLTNGFHSMTVHANDTFGNQGASQTINFTVAKPEPFPIATVALISIALAVVVVADLVVYFKKRKQYNEENNAEAH